MWDFLWVIFEHDQYFWMIKHTSWILCDCFRYLDDHPTKKNTRPKQRHRQKQRRRPQKQRLRRARGFWSAETQGFCWGGRSDGWNRWRFFCYEISLDLLRWFWVFDDSFHDVDVLVLFQHFSRISFGFAEADLVLELVSCLLMFCRFSGCPSWLPIVLVTFWSFWSPIWIIWDIRLGEANSWTGKGFTLW